MYGESWRGAMPFSMRSALEELGQTVYVFDPTGFLVRSRVPAKPGTVLDRVFFRHVACRINRDLQKVLSEGTFDVFFVFKGAHIWPETVRMAWERCRWSLNWNWDDFFNPVHRTPFIESSFGEYSLILTTRRHLAGEYYRRGARRVETIEFCVDPSIHYPVHVAEGQRQKWEADIAFVGSWSPRREEVISRLDDFRVKVWGASWWRSRIRLWRSSGIQVMNRIVECEDMSRVLNAAHIGLNILTIENKDQTNLRNFEIPACGVFQIAERSDVLLEIFEEDKEIVCYSSPEELVDKCRFYLTHAVERAAIAEAGYERVICGSHTYHDRAKQILTILKDDSSAYG